LWLRGEALTDLGLIERDAGRLEAARSHLESVTRTTPGLARARYLLAGVLARSGRAAKADKQRKAFERDAARHASIPHVLGENPGAVARPEVIAIGYEELGLDYLAQIHYEHLLARDPANRVARRGLRRIVRPGN
jgi:tetratricopeptide (TPR) repeat protein